MDNLPNRLVLLLLVLVIVSSIITTLAFFQIEKRLQLARMSASSTAQGKVQIQIINPDAEPMDDLDKSVKSGEIAIEITDKKAGE